MDTSPQTPLTFPATARNRDPILAVLEGVLPPSGTVLEVASGSGEHAAYFAERLPHLVWQPSDPDPLHRDSIAAWASLAAVPNLRPPLDLDTCTGAWPAAAAADAADAVVAVVCINMIHIAALGRLRRLDEGCRRHPWRRRRPIFIRPLHGGRAPDGAEQRRLRRIAARPRPGLGRARPRRGGRRGGGPRHDPRRDRRDAGRQSVGGVR